MYFFREVNIVLGTWHGNQATAWSYVHMPQYSVVYDETGGLGRW